MIEVNEGEVRERHLPAAWGLARGQIVAARKAYLIPKVDWRYERDVIIHPKGLALIGRPVFYLANLMPMIVPATSPSPSNANSFTSEVTPIMRMITASNKKQVAWENMMTSNFFNVSKTLLASGIFSNNCVLLQTWGWRTR